MIRIRCRPPVSPETVHGIRLGRFPDWTDIEIYTVDDDGKEHPITGVTGLTIKAREGQLITARMDVLVEALDVEASEEPPTRRDLPPMDGDAPGLEALRRRLEESEHLIGRYAAEMRAMRAGKRE